MHGGLRRDWFPPTYQVIGKDILRFHSVYWPAFLMAAELPLPRRIIAHAHWTVEVRACAGIGDWQGARADPLRHARHVAPAHVSGKK